MPDERQHLGVSGERVAAAHRCATGDAYGDPAGVDDPRLAAAALVLGSLP